jgi:NadR type nicotinamide-nucleotide adenylyltransferase
MAEKPGRHMKPIRVVITGPECTGKSTLSERLAEYFDTAFVPEYAREYVQRLGRKYNYDDIVHIAETQLEQIKQDYPGKKIVFYDTWLVITKIWLKVVYGHYPEWIDRELESEYVDLWLLCDTDIPWYADGVRENGGEMRDRLYKIYLNEIRDLKGNYFVVQGTGDQRFLNALKIILKTFPELNT